MLEKMVKISGSPITFIFVTATVIIVSNVQSRFDVLILYIIISIPIHIGVFKLIECPIEFDSPVFLKRIEATSYAGVGSAVAISIIYFILWLLH